MAQDEYSPRHQMEEQEADVMLDDQDSLLPVPVAGLAVVLQMLLKPGSPTEDSGSCRGKSSRADDTPCEGNSWGEVPAAGLVSACTVHGDCLMPGKGLETTSSSTGGNRTQPGPAIRLELNEKLLWGGSVDM